MFEISEPIDLSINIRGSCRPEKIELLAQGAFCLRT
jgi:hypothetical protein